MELLRALGSYCDAPAEAVAVALGLPVPSPAQRAALFAFELYPYASVYTSADGMLGGEPADRVAGFWRAVGAKPPVEPDHLSGLLGLYAEAASLPPARARHLRHALAWEHLLTWLPPWLARLEEMAPEPFRAWGRLLREALTQEAEVLGPPSALPLHFRALPAGDGLATVLAPARSGVILTRADLARCARDCGLGHISAARRSQALNDLVVLDGGAVCAWLSREAARQADTYRGLPPAWAPALEHWIARAAATAADFDRLAARPVAPLSSNAGGA